MIHWRVDLVKLGFPETTKTSRSGKSQDRFSAQKETASVVDDAFERAYKNSSLGGNLLDRVDVHMGSSPEQLAMEYSGDPVAYVVSSPLYKDVPLIPVMEEAW